jgi:hypothetical protein
MYYKFITDILYKYVQYLLHLCLFGGGKIARLCAFVGQAIQSGLPRDWRWLNSASALKNAREADGGGNDEGGREGRKDEDDKTGLSICSSWLVGCLSQIREGQYLHLQLKPAANFPHSHFARRPQQSACSRWWRLEGSWIFASLESRK